MKEIVNLRAVLHILCLQSIHSSVSLDSPQSTMNRFDWKSQLVPSVCICSPSCANTRVLLQDERVVRFFDRKVCLYHHLNT